MVDGAAIAKFDQFGRSDVGDISQRVVIVEDHFFLRRIMSFFCNSAIQKHESTHRPILLFLHFSKIRGHVRFHKRSKYNYESNSTEILTVAVYENYFCDSFAIRQ